MGDHRPPAVWRSGRASWALALVCGALAGLALPPLGFPPLLWLALAGLWALPPAAAVLWCGAAVLLSHGWLLWLHPLDWVGIPLPLSLPLCVCLLLACGALGGLMVGAWRWSVEALGGAQMLSTALITAALWGLGEVLLAQGPLFWIGLGAAALPSDRALAGLAQLVGAGGLAALQLLLGWGLWRLLGGVWPPGPRWWRQAALWTLLVLLLHAMGWQRLLAASGHQSEGEPIPLLVLQPDIPTRRKFEADQQGRLLTLLAQAQGQAERLGSRALLLPEGALSLMQPLPRISTVEVLSGGFRQENEELRSALLAFPPGSREASGFLDKHRLVPLGEWIPGADLIRWSGLSAVGGLTAGSSSRLLPRPTGPLAVAICYEISDGHSLAAAVRQGAGWLLTSANLDPYPVQLKTQFSALAQLRAIESGRWLVSSANTGPSLLVDASGRVRQTLPLDRVGTLATAVRPRRGDTLYVHWGEAPLLMLLGSGLLLRRLRR